MNKTAFGVVFVVALLLVAVGALALSNNRNTPQNTAQNDDAGTVIPSGNLSGSVNSAENPAPGNPVSDLPVEPAAAKARTALAGRLGAAESAVVILSIEPATWPNACLGLPQSGEMCAQVMTPGFKVTLAVSCATYIYRTNQAGTMVRAES